MPKLPYPMSQQQGNDLIRVKQYTSPSEEGTVFTVELVHIGLHAQKVFSSVDHPIIVHQVREQLDVWERQWYEQQHLPADQRGRQEFAEDKGEEGDKAKPALEKVAREEGAEAPDETVQEDREIHEPEILTEVNPERISAIHHILPQLLAQKVGVDWEDMKKTEDFTELPPSKPSDLFPTEYPKEPDFQDYEYRPKLNLIDKTISPLKTKKRDKAYRNFQIAYKKWREMCAMIDQENEERKVEYAEKQKEWEKEIEGWEAKKEAFFNEQEEENAKVDALKQQYEGKDSSAIVEYCSMILEKVEYPPAFPRDFKLEYSRYEQCLMLEHAMPSLQDVLMQSEKGEGNAPFTSDPVDKLSLNNKQLAELYESALCSITLGLLHVLFQTDQADALQLIKFNGWLPTVYPESGQEVKEGIISLHIAKGKFMEVNLTDEDPEVLLQQLGGVTHMQLLALKSDGSAEPEGHTEATPDKIAQEEPQHEVADSNEPDNLATMPWKEFEGLLMNILKQEFNVPGGEVKLIRSEHDKGMQAIAFDPDPIRGGKIIIYAYRGEQELDPSVLKTLFEHVMGEGASKGILITTSDYEPATKKFAKDKPLSILNGEHLLSLLDKHGYEFRIGFRKTGKKVE